MADLYIIPERKKYIDYLRFHFLDFVCFLVVQPPLNPKWKDLAIPFHTETWVAALGTFSFGVICILIYAQFYPYAKITPGKGLVFMFAILFDNSHLPTTHIK